MTTIRSEQILDGTIVNVDLAAAAAVDWTKISKTGALLTDLGGTLAWTQLPTGSGTWTATPTIAGTLTATNFSGNGSGLTNLPAANLTGTIPASQVPAYTGDVTSPAGSTVTTIATVNANVGTFGSASQVPQLTVNAKGQVTAVANVAVSGGGAAAAGTLTGTTLAANVVFSSLTSVGTITSGTWSALFGAVSGANLTNLTAANLVGTIPAATLAGRSLADLGTRSAGALNSGSLAWALMPIGNGTWTVGAFTLNFSTFTINGQVNHVGAYTQTAFSALYPGAAGGSGLPDYQLSYYLQSHGSYGLFTNTGLFVSGVHYQQGHFVQSAAGALYPGGAGLGAIADYQQSFYIAAHGSYGLYINTGLYIAGQITCPAGLTLSGSMYTGSSINAVGCITGHAGAGGASANVFSVYWIGTGAQLWIDTSMVGLIGLTSDRRVKQAIAPMTVGLAELRRLQPTSFEWRDAPDDPGEHYGLLAQDVAAVLPVVAMQTTMPHDLAPDGLWRVDYLALVPVLVHAVQELAAEIDALKGNHV